MGTADTLSDPLCCADVVRLVYRNQPKNHHVLRKVQNCYFCNAKRFTGEGLVFCCKSGKVHIHILEVPYELRRLFASQTDRDAKYFRKHIWYFNSHLSFTSFGVSIDQCLATAKGSGVYCFKAHGQIYHKLDPLTPSGKGPRHMQLYFYDTDDSIDHHVKRYNPYVQLFIRLGIITNIQEYTIELNTSISVDQKRYNAPAMEQVAAIWVDGNDAQHRFSRSIVIHGKENDPHYIRDGANEGAVGLICILALESGGSRRWVSAREYKCYKLQIREGQFNQLLVDWYVKVESMRLDWYSKPAHQALIRADLYQGLVLVDTLATGEADASKAGHRIVLSKQFSGSDRDVQSQFMDAMTLVTRYGKPDYFVTMTCNPYWDEIVVELLPGQTPQDRPDVVAQVYHAKLLDLHDFLIKKGHLGTVAAWAHVTEFQKRGLPHGHFLLIPDPNKYPWLHELVVKHMMHGPCGTLNKDYPCMVDGQCHFHYPRQFSETTQQGKDTYPIYRRREDGQKVKVRGEELDNRWVVPYTLVLLMRYNCHINVEICSNIKSVKYLYKYIYKGHDRTSFSVDAKGNEHRVINEIKQYHDARMITAIEAVYRMFGFKLYSIRPAVLRMQVHLPGMHMVTYKAIDNLQDVVDHAKFQRTILTEYFKMDERSAIAHKYLYKEFPELVYLNPNEGDRYYLQVLLTHVRGATSYDSLKTWRAITYDTFRAAAEAMGFVDTNNIR
uniref:Helitron helicase-like domain-containing protein n=1 Tax=Setaria italica TaxID=4555 RepID=K3ZF28_SETIT